MSNKLSTTRILVTSCGTACVEVEVSLDGRIAVDADGNHYKCGTPTRPSAWHGPGIEIWFMAAGAMSVAPWCSKCGAQYKVLVHDEFWPGCTCGAGVSLEPVTVEVFQLEDVEYEDQYGFPRVEKRKREVRRIRLTGIERHKGTFGAMHNVYIAVDDKDNVYTKGVAAGVGWMSNNEYWADRHHKNLAEPSAISIITDMMIAGMKTPATGGMVGNCSDQPVVDLPELLSMFGRFDTGDDTR